MFSCSLLDFVSDMNSNSRQVVHANSGGGDNAPEVVPPTPGASRPRQLIDNDGVAAVDAGDLEPSNIPDDVDFSDDDDLAQRQLENIIPSLRSY